jgi:hypothetical protein
LPCIATNEERGSIKQMNEYATAKWVRNGKVNWPEYFEKFNYNIFNQTVRLKKLIEVIIKYAPENGKTLE